MIRMPGRPHTPDRPCRFAIRLLARCAGNTVSLAQGPAPNLAAASRRLQEALAALDPLLLRQVDLREDGRADVHEAIGLIVESLSLLSKAHRRLDSAASTNGCGIGEARDPGIRLV